MKSDQDIRNSYKVYLEGDDIINLTFTQEQKDKEDNASQSELILEDFEEILKKNPGKKYKMLVDLSPVGNASYISDRSKEIYSKSPVFKDLLKIAVVSTSLILKVITYTISITTGKSDSVRWFDSKNQALKWLSE